MKPIRFRAAWPALLALAIGAAGCGGAESSAEAPAEPPRNVRVVEIGTSTLTEMLEVSGPIRPRRAADLSSLESGVVAATPVAHGAAVSEGQTLVLLDRTLLAAELSAAEARLESAAFDEEHTRGLFQSDAVSGQEMVRREAALRSARAAVDIARHRYQRAAITAPFDGALAERFVERGELVAPGTRVARIVDPFMLVLEGAVSGAEVDRIEVGSDAELRVGGRSFAAAVDWVGLEADAATGKFAVELVVDNADLALRPGVIGRASIPTRAHREVIAIPRDALVQGGAVFVVEQETARRRPLVLGAGQGEKVIVAEGLRAGDRLVVRGQREISDGDAVEVRGTDSGGREAPL